MRIKAKQAWRKFNFQINHHILLGKEKKLVQAFFLDYFVSQLKLQNVKRSQINSLAISILYFQESCCHNFMKRTFRNFWYVPSKFFNKLSSSPKQRYIVLYSLLQKFIMVSCFRMHCWVRMCKEVWRTEISMKEA